MAVPQVVGWPSLTAGVRLYPFCTLDQRILFWPYSSHGESEEHKRPSQTMPADLRPLTKLHLLTFHWPNPKSKDRDMPSAHHEAIARMRMHNSIKGGSKDLGAMIQSSMSSL